MLKGLRKQNRRDQSKYSAGVKPKGWAGVCGSVFGRNLISFKGLGAFFVINFGLMK